jgi:hypothetical protein
MYLREILDDIAERTGHTLTDESVARKVNNLQNQLFRLYVKDSDLSTWDILTGQAQYPLTFPWQDIQEVVIYNEFFNGPWDGITNGHRRSLRKGRVGEYSKSPYYYLLRDTIGIWPTPTADYTEGLQVIRRYLPSDLDINTIDAIPELNEEYHMLLVYGVVADIVDGQKRNEYMGRYMELLNQFRVSQIDPIPQQIISVTGW